jgi:hypothetical protein
MAEKQHSTVIGVFETRPQAERARTDLRHAGFPDGDITMVMHHPDQSAVEVTDLDAAKAAQVTGETKAEEGAGIGAAAGAVAGGLLGLIPGIGPVVFWTPTLAATLFGVAAGAAGGGLVGALVGLDFPEAEARHYEAELKAGRVLVGVKAGDRYPEAVAILREAGARQAGAPGEGAAVP